MFAAAQGSSPDTQRELVQLCDVHKKQRTTYGWVCVCLWAGQRVHGQDYYVKRFHLRGAVTADSAFFYTLTAFSKSIRTPNVFTTRDVANVHPTKTSAAACEQIHNSD